jgi:hypothetical protein
VVATCVGITAASVDAGLGATSTAFVSSRGLTGFASSAAIGIFIVRRAASRYQPHRAPQNEPP